MIMEDKVAEVAANSGNVEAGMQTLQQVTTTSIYLMGFSFILGSCITVLLLMLLDYMRMRREAKAAK